MNAAPTMTYLKRLENQIQDVESDLMNHYLVSSDVYFVLVRPVPRVRSFLVYGFFFILREYITGKDDNF